jgi:hypothetical protein
MIFGTNFFVDNITLDNGMAEQTSQHTVAGKS